MTRFRILPDRSELRIAARSSLHPIESIAGGLEGEAHLEIVDGRLSLGAIPRARLELPVGRLRSGSTLQDLEMQRRVDAIRFPTITAELRGLSPGPGPDQYRLLADLTFHGVTRRPEVDVTASYDRDGTIAVDSQFELDVRGFDVTPPRFFGLRVHPEVKVRVHLVVAED